MEKEKIITFPLVVRVTTKDGWSRQVQYNRPTGPILEVPGSINAGVMAHMLKGYVDKEGDLEGMELMHFLNWAYSFNALPAAEKEGREVQVMIKEYGPHNAS